MIREMLTPENRDWIARAKECGEQYVAPHAAEWDRTAEYPWSAVEGLKKYDLFKVWIPREYGGAGGGVLNLCLVVEELSKVCGGFGVLYAVNSLGSFPIILGGTEEQKQHWLPKIASGEKLIAFGLSEKKSGSDAGSLSCRAERQADGSFLVNGDKKWNTNGNAASIYTVYASTNPERGSRGITAFLVEKGHPGFRIGKKEDLMGIRCVPVHELHFENCSIPENQILGGKEGGGFANAMMTLDRARPAVAAQALGLAQGALDLAIRYTRDRQQFGQSVASFQGVQWMLADMATRIEAARQLIYAAASAIDAGVKNFTKYSAMCKVFGTDVAMEVTTNAVQLFGGYGYCKDYPIEKYMRDAKITQIYEGTNQIQRLVIGRAITKEAAG